MVVEVGVIIEEKMEVAVKIRMGLNVVSVNEEDNGSSSRIDCGKETEGNYRNGGGKLAGAIVHETNLTMH